MLKKIDKNEDSCNLNKIETLEEYLEESNDS